MYDEEQKGINNNPVFQQLTKDKTWPSTDVELTLIGTLLGSLLIILVGLDVTRPLLVIGMAGRIMGPINSFIALCLLSWVFPLLLVIYTVDRINRIKKQESFQTLIEDHQPQQLLSGLHAAIFFRLRLPIIVMGLWFIASLIATLIEAVDLKLFSLTVWMFGQYWLAVTIGVREALKDTEVNRATTAASTLLIWGFATSIMRLVLIATLGGLLNLLSIRGIAGVILFAFVHLIIGGAIWIIHRIYATRVRKTTFNVLEELKMTRQTVAPEGGAG